MSYAIHSVADSATLAAFGRSSVLVNYSTTDPRALLVSSIAQVGIINSGNFPITTGNHIVPALFYTSGFMPGPANISVWISNSTVSTRLAEYSSTTTISETNGSTGWLHLQVPTRLALPDNGNINLAIPLSVNCVGEAYFGLQLGSVRHICKTELVGPFLCSAAPSSIDFHLAASDGCTFFRSNTNFATIWTGFLWEKAIYELSNSSQLGSGIGIEYFAGYSREYSFVMRFPFAQVPIVGGVSTLATVNTTEVQLPDILPANLSGSLYLELLGQQGSGVDVARVQVLLTNESVLQLSNLSVPLKIVFPLPSTCKTPVCNHRDPGQSSWTSRGCQTIYNASSNVCVCLCDRVADFTVLLLDSPACTSVRTVYTNATNETVIDKNGVRVIVTRDEEFGSAGTIVLSFDNSSTKVAGPQLSPLVSIVFLDENNTEKKITDLVNPIRFLLPLQPGASDAVEGCLGTTPVTIIPACKWFDPVSETWTGTGCTTKLKTSFVECSCYHLTLFALVLPKYNALPVKQLLQLTPENLQSHPGGGITIAVILLVFVLVLTISIQRDRHERARVALKAEKFAQWKDRHMGGVNWKSRVWKQYKNGYQTHHTWGSLLFRKAGTSFRSVDRTFVALMLVLILMSVSAGFRDQNQPAFAKGVVMIISLCCSVVPGQILTHLFMQTGERGFFEQWEFEQGIRKPSRLRCLRYRFPEWCRWVWYGAVVACAIGMIVYILSVALMFDQNPHYYCQGDTTTSWILDFMVSYVLSVFVVEPIRIGLVVVSKHALETARSPSESPTTMAGKHVVIESPTTTGGMTANLNSPTCDGLEGDPLVTFRIQSVDD